MFLAITLTFLNDPCVSVTGPAGSVHLPDEPRRSLQRHQEAVLRRVPRPVAGHQRRDDLEEAEASQRHPEGGAADQLQARRRAVGRRNPVGQCNCRYFVFICEHRACRPTLENALDQS